MIKVAVWGGGKIAAGELIRILLLHPEVELIGIVSHSLQGESVQNHHYGLKGEKEIRFVSNLDLSGLDVLFVAGEFPEELLAKIPESYSDLKVIGFDRDLIGNLAGSELTAPALSEIFRKNLVRGARYSFVISPVASLILISLFPLAKNLLLNKDITIEVQSPLALSGVDKEKTEKEVSDILSEIQNSFDENIQINFLPSSEKRGMAMKCTLRCAVPLNEVEGLYEGIYDDHNFTFLTEGEVSVQDIAGTQKCLIKLSKPNEETLVVESVADPMMRGSAGDAVHAMNLLLGLYEKIGLSFRAV